MRPGRGRGASWLSPWWSVPLALLAPMACRESPTAGSDRARMSPFALTADSGRVRDRDGIGKWRSVVVGGKVREVHEQLLLFRTQLADRRYEFDEQGVLRHFAERMRPLNYVLADTARTIDTTRISTRTRESTIDFLTDGPAFATRRMGDRPLGFRKLEMRTLQARGYALLDSARSR